MSGIPLIDRYLLNEDDTNAIVFINETNTCPCRPFRNLQDADAGTTPPTDSPTAAPVVYELWEILYTVGVLVFLFAALISERIGADSVMLTCLTLFLLSGIIDLKEGLEGFSNSGVLTVMVLYIVAEGISRTGALDWYMSKLLGRPETNASAQLRLMIPVTIVSAFMNNTPIVAIMIPVIQRWCKNVNISPSQLMIPLSFAAIFGGTCTLIGTSTNLVVESLLADEFPDDPDMQIGLFSLGIYGVPLAIAGIIHVVLFSPWLLPGGSRRRDDDRGDVPLMGRQEDILLGARLLPWSPSAGRSVKRSGLRETGGIYLVSVYRAATGNVHRAVGPDFVLNVGDVLYFTGLVEEFGDFCEEHGLEILTGDLDKKNLSPSHPSVEDETQKPSTDTEEEIKDGYNIHERLLQVADSSHVDENTDVPPEEIGITKDSQMQADDDAERSRDITRMIDLIRGVARDEPTQEEGQYLRQGSGSTPRKQQAKNKNTDVEHKVVVTSEQHFVVVGIDTSDRPGLLLDISKVLLKMNMSLRHSEASVVGNRSISIWRCEMLVDELPDLEEIGSVLTSFLNNESGNQIQKQRGLRVIRAVIGPTSTLTGKSAKDYNFRERFKAALVAIQKSGKNVPLSTAVFGPNDILVLQVDDDSALLKVPPADFYKKEEESATAGRPSVASFIKAHTKSLRSSLTNPSAANPDAYTSENIEDQGIEHEVGSNALVSDEEVWRDLRVLFVGTGSRRESNAPTREFLTAMKVASKSQLVGRSIESSGLDKLNGVFLVSIDRPTGTTQGQTNSQRLNMHGSVDGPSIASVPTVQAAVTAVATDMPLEEGDILWFAGGAQAVGDLRKVPGLISYESDEVQKLNENSHDRRLVEAVIARRGDLVGKTVKQVRFRTRYGAAVIAVHRNGKRIHEHPGQIKLQAGDVLLLEAGATFIKGSADRDRSFVLLAEVEDSKPPRFNLLIPALLIIVAMVAVATADVVNLLVCAMVASILMVAIGVVSEQEARDSVNWDVYVTIACAFGIGTALKNSGVAGGMATFLVGIGESVGLGDIGIFAAVYVTAALISAVVTNNAAAAIVFPIALGTAEKAGVDPMLMSYCVMLGSSDYMTPFGYQTNLMVYGPGGYKYMDYVYIGAPLTLILWILVSVLLATQDASNFYISWLASFAALAIVMVTGGFDKSSRSRKQAGSEALPKID